MPVLPPPTVARRERAIRITVAASVAAKAFSVACTLAQVPLALHYLGTETYGFWVTLVGVVVMLNFVDFGLGVGMQHAMARGFGVDDMDSVRRVFWSGVALLGVLGLGFAAVGVPLALLYPWNDALHLADPELRASCGRALALAVALVAVALPFNASTRLVGALQRGWIHAGWIAAGSALSLGLVAAAARGRWGFLWFLGASLLVPAAQGLGLTLHLLFVLRWRPWPCGFSASAELGAMLRSSASFAFPQFGQALVQATPSIAISLASGSASVTAFNLLTRLFSPFLQSQLILLTPVWPAYTEAHARGDHAWVRRALGRTLAATAALAACVGVAGWQSAALLRLWVGSATPAPSRALVGATAAWSVLQMAVQPLVYYLAGIGRLRRLAWAATPGMLVTTAALLVGARSAGAVGVIAAGSAALALSLLLPLALETLRSVKSGGAS